ncbi:hypothetical protein [Bradyrhizobium sp. RT6a]|uniref:hypothetical protein n=1 Tax=unclassified Bradyrhizobium TaxID=2631580 RepID=UPI0033999D1D
MTRALLFIVVTILCASCRTDAQLDPIQATAIIDAAEVTDREECLYQEVARLMEPKGSSPISLQNVAVAATRFCSATVRKRLERAASVSPSDAQTLARDDQMKTEHRAFAIGLELREKRTNAGMAGN